jgi:hypothetical protein
VIHVDLLSQCSIRSGSHTDLGLYYSVYCFLSENKIKLIESLNSLSAKMNTIF